MVAAFPGNSYLVLVTLVSQLGVRRQAWDVLRYPVRVRDSGGAVRTRRGGPRFLQKLAFSFGSASSQIDLPFTSCGPRLIPFRFCVLLAFHIQVAGGSFGHFQLCKSQLLKKSQVTRRRLHGIVRSYNFQGLGAPSDLKTITGPTMIRAWNLECRSFLH